jgi:hypothetical protein
VAVSSANPRRGVSDADQGIRAAPVIQLCVVRQFKPDMTLRPVRIWISLARRFQPVQGDGNGNPCGVGRGVFLISGSDRPSLLAGSNPALAAAVTLPPFGVDSGWHPYNPTSARSCSVLRSGRSACGQPKSLAERPLPSPAERKRTVARPLKAGIGTDPPSATPNAHPSRTGRLPRRRQIPSSGAFSI